MPSAAAIAATEPPCASQARRNSASLTAGRRLTAGALPGSGAGGGRERDRPDHTAPAEQRGAVEAILQLADVARPVVVEQRVQGRRRQLLRRQAEAALGLLQGEPGQQGDVLPALPQRRQVRGEHGQAVVQLRPQLPARDGLGRGNAHRREDADVSGDGGVAAEADDLSLLQRHQQLGLDRQGHRVQLVEEQRAPARSLEPTGPAAPGAGEGAGGDAEQLALDQLGGDGRAVDVDKRPPAPGAGLVDPPGEMALAGPPSPHTAAPGRQTRRPAPAR